MVFCIVFNYDFIKGNYSIQDENNYTETITKNTKY